MIVNYIDVDTNKECTVKLYDCFTNQSIYNELAKLKKMSILVFKIYNSNYDELLYKNYTEINLKELSLNESIPHKIINNDVIENTNIKTHSTMLNTYKDNVTIYYQMIKNLSFDIELNINICFNIFYKCNKKQIENKNMRIDLFIQKNIKLPLNSSIEYLNELYITELTPDNIQSIMTSLQEFNLDDVFKIRYYPHCKESNIVDIDIIKQNIKKNVIFDLYSYCNNKPLYLYELDIRWYNYNKCNAII